MTHTHALSVPTPSCHRLTAARLSPLPLEIGGLGFVNNTKKAAPFFWKIVRSSPFAKA